jgi:hypothetical protein
MKWAALITWVVTAGGGFVLLALWLQGGGMRQSGRSGAVIRPPLILGHFALAATGLVLWIIYVATDTEALAWIAFALLAIVAVLGFTMFAIWLQQRRVAPSAAPAGMGPTGGAAPATAGAGPAPGPGAAPTQPAERRFPIPIVAAHGLFAAATLVLVLLTAAGVGES